MDHSLGINVGWAFNKITDKDRLWNRIS
jgi:hypothetical protein